MTLISVTLAGATKANPVVITTATAHGLSDNDEIQIIDTVGMTELNDKWYSVTVLSTTTASLQAGGSDVDGTAYTTWSSAGTVKTASYSFNEDAQDLFRLFATLSKIKLGDTSAEQIKKLDFDEIRSRVYDRIYGRLVNVFTAADIQPSMLKNRNPIRTAEAHVVLAEYLRALFSHRGEEAREIANSYENKGWEYFEEVTSGSVALFDYAGDKITLTRTLPSLIDDTPTVLPAHAKLDGSEADITSLSGRGVDNDFNTI